MLPSSFNIPWFFPRAEVTLRSWLLDSRDELRRSEKLYPGASFLEFTVSLLSLVSHLILPISKASLKELRRPQLRVMGLRSAHLRLYRRTFIYKTLRQERRKVSIQVGTFCLFCLIKAGLVAKTVLNYSFNLVIIQHSFRCQAHHEVLKTQ